MERFVKGSISSAHVCQISERELRVNQVLFVAKAARRKLGEKIAQKGGVITVRDVRAKVTKRT